MKYPGLNFPKQAAFLSVSRRNRASPLFGPCEEIRISFIVPWKELDEDKFLFSLTLSNRCCALSRSSWHQERNLNWICARSTLFAASLLYSTCSFHLSVNLISGEAIADFPRHGTESDKTWTSASCIYFQQFSVEATTLSSQTLCSIRFLSESAKCIPARRFLVNNKNHSLSATPRSRDYPERNLISILVTCIDSIPGQHSRMVSSLETLLGAFLKVSKRKGLREKLRTSFDSLGRLSCHKVSKECHCIVVNIPWSKYPPIDRLSHVCVSQ